MPGPSVAAVVLAILAIVGPWASSDAAARSSRSPCTDVGVAATDPFGALTREYIAGALSGDDPLGNQASADDIAGGAVVIVVTRAGRAAKLVASRHGRTLRIERLVVYGGDGAETAAAGPLRLADNATLDVATARVNPPGADGDVRWARVDGVRALRALNGARIRALVSVPVVAHFMKSTDPFFADNDVEDSFPPSRLASLTAPAAALNATWRPAGVFFFVRRAERCPYLLDDFRPGVPAGALEVVPSPASDCLALFSKINRAYNFAGVPSLDLYVWWSLGVADLLGYGAPHKGAGATRQHGGIWVDRACVDPDVNSFDCGHTLAHEGGHFLGLCHRCATSPVATTCAVCANIPACSPVDDDGFLMRDDARGGRLSPADIRLARAKALERFKGSVQRRSH